jgi:hypothetical protein
MQKVRSLAVLPVLAVLASVLSGCGGPSTATVSGEVTYDGQAVENGYITFTPTDGKGQDASAPIRDGRYTIAELQPGPKLVKVIATRRVNFAASSEEMKERAAEARLAGNHDGLVDPADVIPDNAEGNNAQMDIPPGPSTRDFPLKKPQPANAR